MKSADKILSFYEPDVHVIVRGKAGAEFGNTLVLGEADDGVIVDWQLICEQARPIAIRWDRACRGCRRCSRN